MISLIDQVKLDDIDAVRQLLAGPNAPHIDIRDDEFEGTSLYWAARNGQLRMVEFLLASGADINSQTKSGSTAIYTACFGGHIDTVRLLLDRGADVNKANEEGASPLFVASQEGHLQIVQLLIERKAKIDLAKKTGATPLYAASQRGHKEVVTFLLDSGADIRLSRETGATPLYIACENGHTAVAQALIKAGSDFNKPTTDGQTPLQTASRNGHVQTVALLLNNHADVNGAIKNSHSKRAGWTALHFAAYKNQHKVVALLYDRGANISMKAKDKKTPLDIARELGHQEVVDILVGTKSSFGSVDSSTEIPATLSKASSIFSRSIKKS